MEPHVYEKLQALVGEKATGGRAGGVSLFIRALVFPKIGEPFSNQRWRSEFDIPMIDQMEGQVAEWWRIATTVPTPGEQRNNYDYPTRAVLERKFKEALDLADQFFKERDLINMSRAEHLVSRLALLRRYFTSWKG
jgi:hypothetical protein